MFRRYTGARILRETMSMSDIAIAAEQFTREEACRFLARLAFELTIAARDTYVADSEDIADPRQLRAFNEIQHRVTSSLVDAMAAGNGNSWLWPFISETADKAGVTTEYSGPARLLFRLSRIQADRRTTRRGGTRRPRLFPGGETGMGRSTS